LFSVLTVFTSSFEEVVLLDSSPTPSPSADPVWKMSGFASQSIDITMERAVDPLLEPAMEIGPALPASFRPPSPPSESLYPPELNDADTKAVVALSLLCVFFFFYVLCCGVERDMVVRKSKQQEKICVPIQMPSVVVTRKDDDRAREA
jgi:hypothetical protein